MKLLLKNHTIRICLAYLVLGAGWILFSGDFFDWLGADFQNLHWFGFARGLTFVVVSSVLLGLVIHRHQKVLEQTNRSLENLVNQRTADWQAVNEELTAANEEYQAANEELMIMNEQLQAASAKINEQAQTILRQKDEQLNRVLDSSQDAIFSIDLSGGSDHYLSRSCMFIFGRDVHEHALDRDFWMQRTHPQDREVRAKGREVMARDGNAEIITRMRFADGSYHWVYERHRYVYANGKPIRQEGIASDITRLKSAEQQVESEKKLLRSLIDNFPDYIYVKDKNLKHIINNKANVELLGGQTEAETLGKSMVDYFGEAARPYLEDDLSVLKSGVPLLNREEKLIDQNGAVRTLLTTKVPLFDEEGHPNGLVGISRDVTEYRKQEAELSAYRENLDIIFSNTNENFLLLDQTGRIVLFNKALERTIAFMIGRSPKVGEFLWDITTPERRETSQQLVQRVLAGEDIRVDARVPGETGEVILDVRYSAVRVNEDVKYIIVLSTDVTEKRNQEKAIRQYQENLDIIFSNTVEEILLLDETGKIVLFNNAFEEFIRYATHVAPQVGQYLWEVTVPERRPTARLLFQQVLEGNSFTVDAPIRLSDKTVIHELRYSPVWVDERVKYVTIISTDVTARRRQEELLRQSEKNLKTIFETTGELFALLDKDYRIRTFNSAYLRNAIEFTGKELKIGESILYYADEDRRAGFLEMLKRVEAGEIISYTRNFSKSEEARWFQVNIKRVTSDTDAFDGFCISAVDVTEIQRAKDSLKASEERFRALVENSDDVFAIVDSQGVVKYVSPNVSRILGYTEAEFIGLRNSELVHPDDLAKAKEDWEMLGRSEGQHFQFIRKIKHRDGRWLWLEGVSVNLFQTPGVNGRVSVYHDVTERKQREKNILELKDSLADFQSAIFRSSIVSRADKKGNITFVNENFVKISGYTQAELLGQNHRVINSGYHPREFWVDMWKTIAKGQIWRKEVRNRAKDGSLYWVDTFVMPFIDEAGQVREFLSIRNDITERKNAEEQIIQLNLSLADFKNAIHKSSIVSIADRRGNITYVNENFVRISGYTEGELLGENHRLINSGYHPKEFWVTMWNVIASGRIWREEVKNKAKDGTYYWVDTFVMPFLDENGKPREFLSIRNDITQRKRTEEELLRNKILLDKANEVAKIGHWTYDPAVNKSTWSKTALAVLGLSDDFAGGVEGYLDIIHPDDLPAVRQAVGEVLNQKKSYNIDHRVLLKDGSIRWVHEEAKEVLDDYGNLQFLIGVVQDITERKNVESILREYNERYDILSKATNDAIWDWDIVHDFEKWNHGLHTIFGYNETIIHHPIQWWLDKIHPTDYHRIEKTIDEAFGQKKNNWSASYRYRCADGTYKHVLDRAYIIYHNEQPIRMIGAVQDITEQKRSHEEIEKLSLVASKTNNSVIITDPFDRIEWTNEAFTRLTGYSLQEAVGRKPGSFLQGPDTNPETVARISKQIKSRVPVSEEIVNYSKSGRKYWLKLNITPVFNERHELQHFIAVQSDITEQKAYENRITSIARELSSLIENANVPIFGVDRNGYINEWNKVSVELSEYTKNDVLGKMWTDLLDVRLRDAVKEVLQRVFAGNPVGNYELPFASKTGRQLIFLVTVSPRRDVNDNIIGAICVAQDLTELIQYRQGLERVVEERTRELHQALQKEKELVEMKSKFVSIASHEFRTPLTTISIASGFIKKYKDRLSAEEFDKKIDSIKKQVNHMTYLLDDVLMVGKAEAGRIEVQPKPVGIKDFIEKILDEIVQTTNHTHEIRLAWEAPVEELETDEKLIRNVIINLLTNAIKFSPDAKWIDMRVWSSPTALHVSVRDYGIGIPQEDIGKLFQSFQRGSNVSSIQGTGLGLSIVKKAIELLGGTIQVESELHQGTAFTFTLPL